MIILSADYTWCNRFKPRQLVSVHDPTQQEMNSPLNYGRATYLSSLLVEEDHEVGFILQLSCLTAYEVRALL